MGPPTIAQVKAHIDKINKKCAKLDKALSKGDKLNYLDGIKIAKKAVKLTSRLKKAAKDVRLVPDPILESDAKDVLDKVNVMLPVCFGALDRVVAARQRFDKLQIAGLVNINVKRLNDGQVQLAQALIDRAPAEPLKAEGEEIQKSFNEAFARTLSAYSNAKGGEDKEAEIENAPDSDADPEDV